MKENLNKEDYEFNRMLIRHRRKVGWINVIFGILFFGLVLFIVLASFDFDDLFALVVVFSLFGGLGIIIIIAGIRDIRLNPYRRTDEERKTIIKKIVTFVSVFTIFSIIFMITYNLNQHEGEIKIYKQEQIELKEEYSTSGIFSNESYSIKILDLNLTLKCSEECRKELLKSFMDNKNDVFYVKYQWNSLYPVNGKVLAMTKK